MGSHSIATIILYCTNDFQFLARCVKEAQVFSQQVIVVYGSHFFDGTPENELLLEKSQYQGPNCQFIKFPFHIEKEAIFDNSYGHNIARWVGINYLKSDIDYVLFLDVDEVVNGAHFLEWLETGEYRRYDTIKIENYWYFREPVYQATTTEQSVIMVKANKIHPKRIFSKKERQGLVTGTRLMGAKSVDGHPMIHHYSWVRDKQAMIKKVISWGHKNDRDWISLIEAEFSHPFSGKDFVHGYSFTTVSSFIETKDSVFREQSPLIQLTDSELEQLEYQAVKRIKPIRTFFKSLISGKR